MSGENKEQGVSVERIYKIVGYSIKLERKAIGMTQTELGNKIGLNRASISNIELGRQRIMLHDIEKTAEVLKVKLTELL